MARHTNDVLYETLSGGADSTDAIVFDHVRIDFKQLRAETKRARRRLTGERLHFLPRPTEPNWVYEYLACIAMGKVAVATPEGRIDQAGSTTQLQVRFAKLIERTDDIPDGTTVVLPTSGSAGEPDWVCVTARNLLYNTLAIVDRLALSAQRRVYCQMPLSYCFALSVLNTHLAVGGTYITTSEPFSPRTARRAFEDDEANGLAAVPSMLRVLDRGKFFESQGGHVAHLQQAGGPLSNDLAQRICSSLGPSAAFYKMYGQTEATARISAFNVMQEPRKIGSVGRPLDHLSVSIEVGADTGEEIVVAGPSVTPASLTPAGVVLRPVSLHTGDLGTIDSAGYLYIHGRSSAIIKIGGNRFNAELVEMAALQTGRIDEVVAFGFPDEVYGERVGLVVVPKAAFPTMSRFRRELALSLPSAVALGPIWLVDSLPHAPNGKVNRETIRKTFVETEEKGSENE